MRAEAFSRDRIDLFTLGNHETSRKRKGTSPANAGEVQRRRLEAESGEHAAGARRAIAVPAAVAKDAVEVHGVARGHGASPAIATRRGSGTVRRRHALGFVVLVLGAVGLHIAPDLGHREREDLETEDWADNVSLSIIFNISIKTYIA